LAQAVYLNGRLGSTSRWSTNTDSALLLVKDATGYWTGFLAGVQDGDLYKYYVVGQGSVGYKRDPYARELTASTTFPFGVNCIVRSPSSYPWHDQSFVTPDYSNLIIYQLHIGVFAPAAFPNCGTFLDVIAKIPCLVALGINLLQPLPIAECKDTFDEGYDGADPFSPDSLYTVYDPTALGNYLTNINGLLAAKGCVPLTLGQITGGPNQLKAMVDLCHLYGIAVAFDVVYNHAGGFEGDDESIYFWDREALPSPGTNNESLFFTNVSVGGGLSFALWKQNVCQFLIDNASFFVSEFHVDAFRYDEISLLLGANQPGGWTFCQNLTSTCATSKIGCCKTPSTGRVNSRPRCLPLCNPRAKGVQDSTPCNTMRFELRFAAPSKLRPMANPPPWTWGPFWRVSIRPTCRTHGTRCPASKTMTSFTGGATCAFRSLRMAPMRNRTTRAAAAR